MTEATDTRLRNHVEALERLAEEIKGIRDDMKDRFNLLKSEGYDAKIVRLIIKLRSMRPDDRREMETITDLYKSALGID